MHFILSACRGHPASLLERVCRTTQTLQTMRRPKIQKDALTEVLRANISFPQLSPQPDEPISYNTWHRCCELDSGIPEPKFSDTAVSSLEAISKPNIQPAEFLSWLRMVRTTPVAYCSGNYLQDLRGEFLDPGMVNYCLQGLSEADFDAYHHVPGYRLVS